MTPETLKRILLLYGVRVEFQPRISTATNQITGFEALARIPMSCEEHGPVIPPSVFLPLLRPDTRVLLFCHVLGKVMEVIRRFPDWFTESEQPITIGINIDPALVVSSTVRNRLLAVPLAYRQHIELELLEHRIPDMFHLADGMTMLKKEGFSFVVDDFGTEGAGLSVLLLHTVGVKKIKFDKIFIPGVRSEDTAGVVDSESTRADSKFFIDLAHFVRTTGLRIVVEQVEQLAQLQSVAPHVHEIQGFYYGKPASFELWADQRDRFFV